MPVGSKQAVELWTPVMNKSTGKPYAGLERCSSLEKLEQEDKALSDTIDAELNKWMDQDQEAHQKELNDFKKGFTYKHTDGYTYKLIQFDNGNYSLSRSKPFAGGARRGFTPLQLKTVSVQIVRTEQVATLINDQQPNDNFEVIPLQADQKGDRFMLLLKKPYIPSLESGNTNAKEEAKSEEDNETEEETTEQ